MGPTKEDVYTALRTCKDPEIPVNIVDLGLVYSVDLAKENDGAAVTVKMTLTSQGCPMSNAIAGDVHKTLLQVDGIKQARVEIVWEPVWRPDMITEEGRRTLNLT
ncbi:metal-sulfur cluster assembly factor [Opitutaceae bacterium TAV4]|uniref:metal-sulfur cluster assembly factor n=1 Tax=Geminisphaera colitermitum TaxID=1148786 RepID=UPI000158D93E|nr:metal-sulfur cluster assembly factor [Geminisphaera colitermitum]RRJ97902.1 metal-sulfur cluster assembly factor [Opitutaceae bacterium TAV4]RRK02445.1 metal-sulfur cluster assembly factor [Opitutaceae bacterium TAV3]